MKIALLTNIPAPYRVPVFNRLAAIYRNDFTVVYSNRTEANRHWLVKDLDHNHYFLNENKQTDIIKVLNTINPDIIITSGFNFIMITAWLFTRFKGAKHVVFTDNWLHPVNQLSILHKIIRKIIIKNSEGYLAIGKKSREFLECFGAKPDRIFISQLSIDVDYYSKFKDGVKEYDLMFSGQFIERKLPDFFVNVAVKINQSKKIKCLIIGEGPLKEKFLGRMKEENLCFDYKGFIQQAELPVHYSKSKILLFPTRSDPWGLVANESLAVGTAVITCENAGAAEEIVLDGYNGFISKMCVDKWAETIISYIEDDYTQALFSENAAAISKQFTFASSTAGIVNLINYLQNEKNITVN